MLPLGQKSCNLVKMSTKELTKTHHELIDTDVMTVENPRSVVNLLPPKVREKVLKFNESHPEYFNKPEDQLYKLLKDNCALPNQVEDTLRMKFWVEYERAQSLGLRAMNMSNISNGVVTYKYFFDLYMNLATRVAWLMCPPINYVSSMDEILHNCWRTFSDAARMEFDPKDPDFKVLDYKLKIFREVDARRNGVQVQRIETKSESKILVGHVNATNEQDLERILREAKKRESELDGAIKPAEIVVTSQTLDMTVVDDD